MTRALGWFAVLALATAAIAYVSRSAPESERASLYALYCGGRLAAGSQNPYLFRPLAACEHQAASPYAIVAPAAEPGYDLAAIEPIAALPFRVFAVICFAIIAGALCIAAASLGATIRCPPPLIGAALAPLAYICARHGELLTPVCLGAICLCAYFLSRRRYAAAGIATAVALCQPELGLPVAASLLLFVPRARRAVLSLAVVMGAISIIALGVRANVLYFLGELPRQARAEIAFPGQFGVPWVVHAFIGRSGAALALGSLAFVAATVILLLVARKTAVTFQRPEALALIPPVAAVSFGISTYDWSMLVAVPATLFVLFELRAPAWLGVAALSLVAIPWQAFATLSARTPEMAGAIAGLHAFSPGALSSTYWQVYLQYAFPRAATFAAFAWKVPTWAGLAIVLACILARTRAPATQLRPRASAIDPVAAGTSLS
jgi:hypothetical protein